MSFSMTHSNSKLSENLCSIDKANETNELHLQSTELNKSNNEIEVEQLTRWYLLPIDVCDRIWSYIGEADMIGYIYMLAKTPFFRPSPLVFRHLCEIIYVGQTLKGQLVLEKWSSWRRMLINRPRLRTNGFYCMKEMYSRAPNNDSFWEEKRTQSVEVPYYY